MDNLEKAKIFRRRFYYWYKAKRRGRQHVIHKRVSGSFDNNDLKIICGTNPKRIACSVNEWNEVECILCLRKGASELIKEVRKEFPKNDCGGCTICNKKRKIINILEDLTSPNTVSTIKRRETTSRRIRR